MAHLKISQCAYNSNLTLTLTCICMYVRDSIRFCVLCDIMNESFEVSWVKIRPKRLTRRISSIIVGTVYHSPSVSDSSILDCLYESLSTIEALFPDCSLTLLRDFNRLNCTRLPSTCNLKQIVPFETRGQSKLDLIFTNLSAFYDVPNKLPPLGLSDHDTVSVQPLARQDLPKIRSCLNQENAGYKSSGHAIISRGSQPWSPGRSQRVMRIESAHARNNNQDRHGYLASP